MPADLPADLPGDAPGDAPAARDDRRLGHRTANSALLLWGTTMLLRVLQLVTTTILARLLNPADYGVVAMAMVVTGFIDTLSNLQVGSAITKTRDLTREHLDAAFTLNLLRGILSALALVALARPAARAMHDARLADVLYVLAIPALVGGIHNPNFLLFARDLDFSKDSKRNALAAVLGSVTGIVGALVFRSYWALVASSVVTGLTWTLFSYWRVPAMPRLGLRRSREILGYGSWLVLIGVLNFVTYRMDYVLIGRFVGTGALGAYNVAQVLTVTATGDVVESLGKALFPAFSMISGDLERLRSGYRRVQSIALALALPIGFGMSALAAEIVLVLVGHKWAMAIPVVAALAPVSALQSMTASIDSLALSLDKGRWLFFRTLAMLGMRGSFMLVGFHVGGFMGIVYARVISGVLALAYSQTLAATMLQGRWIDPVLASWRSFAAVAVMWVGLKLLFPAAVDGMAAGMLAGLLVVKILTGAALYVGTHGGLWALAGRPDGAERSLLAQAGRLRRR